MIQYLNNARKAFAVFFVRHFHCFHSYKLVGGKFIGAYLPDFMDEEGFRTFVVCQNGKCSKCGKEIQWEHQIKGGYNLTRGIVEKYYCA